MGSLLGSICLLLWSRRRKCSKLYTPPVRSGPLTALCYILTPSHPAPNRPRLAIFLVHVYSYCLATRPSMFKPRLRPVELPWLPREDQIGGHLIVSGRSGTEGTGLLPASGFSKEQMLVSPRRGEGSQRCMGAVTRFRLLYRPLQATMPELLAFSYLCKLWGAYRRTGQIRAARVWDDCSIISSLPHFSHIIQLMDASRSIHLPSAGLQHSAGLY